MTHTEVDLWRLCVDYKGATIVAFNNLGEKVLNKKVQNFVTAGIGFTIYINCSLLHSMLWNIGPRLQRKQYAAPLPSPKNMNRRKEHTLQETSHAR